MSPPDQRALPVILAAGLGTRMKSRLPKLLHPILGRPMLAYVVDAARTATAQRPLVVYSPATSQICDVFSADADFALQDEPRGTGDALRAAFEMIGSDVREIVVLNGDVPLIDPSLIAELVELRREEAAEVALLIVDTFDPGHLGRIVRDSDGSVERIVEAKDATPDELDVREINVGIYAFDAEWARSRVARLTPSAASGEVYLTQLVAIARAEGRTIAPLEVADDGTLLGINDRSELAEAAHDLQARINERHLLAGVSMLDPTTAYVEPSVELAQDVTLEPNVILRGRTRVGEGTRIGAGSQIFDTVIGRDCQIWASVLESSEVADEVEIGPFSHLRAGSSIGRGAKLGNFAEVKNSRLGAGVQQHHFSYLGDAELGERTNVGAGTITANYDGHRKLKTKIGERVFLGVDTMLVAPVELGDEAKTGAGAVVTRDVPPGKLAVGVPARIREPRHAPDDERTEATEATSPTSAAGPPPAPIKLPSAPEAGGS